MSDREITLEMLSGKWKPATFWWIGREPHRFNELLDSIPGLTKQTFSERLKELERDGLIKRVVFKEKPPRVEYSLTELGEELGELTNKMCHLGKKIKPEAKFIFEEVIDTLQ